MSTYDPSSTALLGDISCPHGSDNCNPCAFDVVTSIKGLSQHGDIMGFNWGADYPDFEHWQGIQCLYAPNAGLNGQYLAVSSSHDDKARFALVKLASRNTDGLRFRSNRLNKGKNPWRVAPPSEDQLIQTIIASEDYNHPGAMQAIGKYLLVPFERGNRNQTTASVSCFDLTGGACKKLWDFKALTAGGASIAAAKLSHGPYLMIIGGANNVRLDFYISATNSMENPDWQHLATWSKHELHSELTAEETGRLDLNWPDYQSIGLVVQYSDGTLYLLASHGRSRRHPFSKDWLDAYRLRIMNTGDVTITKVAKRHLFCRRCCSGRQCHFQAAAGVYVSPDNQIFYYATEHNNDGPCHSVKMMEFRPVPHRIKIDSINDAWVELFSENYFRGRSIILDYLDKNKQEYDEFNKIERFCNKTSSLLFGIPEGYRIRLYENTHQSGGYLDLVGNGSIQRLKNLHEVQFNNGKNVGDRIKSAEWRPKSS